ncbi:methyltransferase-like protein 22 [Zingiber officinale]|uniref:methyltransferase-like protein 22 n=1 Tax=Zingiber officinale TaxID=94328 RepID=UPI001C4ADB35|nr:methyltransferase-like protein 22 [Zingiber officinale]
MANQEGEEQVMSEVHLGCPPHVSGPYISHFAVSLPPTRHAGRLPKGAASRETLRLDNGCDYAQNGENCCSFEHNDSQSSAHIPQQEHLSLDKDGDLVLTRRENPNNRCLSFGLSIQHSITSSLLEVGLQVWKAALVLTDFVLHKSSTSSYFNDVVAVELGAGTGLVGIVLSRIAKKVFITDKGVHILNNCDANTHVNWSMLKCKDNTVCVRELDWMDSWPPNATTDSSPRSRSPNKRYLWSSEEIEEVESATVLLAADVIYSDELTDSFFSMVEKIMARGSHKTLYLALEKRYNFSLDELNVVANGYSHFRTYFKSEEYGEGDGLQPGFVGKQIDLAEIPQYIREYDRGKDVELWKITYRQGGLGVLPQ